MSKDYVICPICNKQFKVITMTHLKVHEYSCKEDFIKDYPNVELVSETYKEENRILRSRVFTELNKSDSQRKKASIHAKKLNSNSELQRSKALKGWTPERRELKSVQLKSVINQMNTSDKYEEFRIRRLKGFSYGKRIPYKLNSNEIILLRSFLECKACKFLELNNFNFKYESVEIGYEINNRIHKYFPDFYLLDYNLLLEVKPKSKVNDDIVQLKKYYSEKSGYNFLFVTEDDLKDYKTLLQKIALHAK